MMSQQNIEVNTLSEFLSSFEHLIFKSLPTVVVMELSIITTIVNMYYIIGRENVIAIGFGAIYANLVVKGLLLSINQCITQIMHKYFKEHQYLKIGISYQRSLILNGVFLIIITPFLAASKSVLEFLYVPQDIAEGSMQYVWEMLPAMYAFTFFDCTKNYLQSMGIHYPVVIIQSFTSILHIILSKHFIVILGLGVRGAAWAKNFSSCASALLIYFYIAKYQSQHPAWVEWDKRTLKSIAIFAKQLIAKSFKNYIQQSSFEIMALVAIGLSFEEFCVCVCLIFTAQSISMFYFGVAKTASGQIIDLFKKTEFEIAKTQATYYMATSVLLGLLISLLLYIFKEDWISIFYMDDQTSQILESMVPLFMITLTIGGCQIMLASLLNAIGENNFVLNFQLITQYVIGIFLGWYLAFTSGQGLKGLWVGWGCGLSVSAFCLMVKMALVDWNNAGKQILVVVEDRK